MNIFVVSEGAWDNRRSDGNTFSNWFTGEVWKNDHFFNFYTRFQLPNNEIDVDYLRLTAVDAVKGLFKGKTKGLRFSTVDIPGMKDQVADSAISEQKKIDKIHSKKGQFIYLIYELFWISRIWMGKQVKSFILQDKPDILFAFAASPAILWPLIDFACKNTKCKIILFVADNTYGAYDVMPYFRRFYLKKLLAKCIKKADKLYAASEEMCALYETIFNKSVSTLYKGCDLSQLPKHYLNEPLRFVYAGNLLWGRDESLAILADAIESINGNNILATLEIYTSTTITDTLDKKLNRGVVVRLIEAKPYPEIKKIMREADVVLHVESFEPQMIDIVKYSFSTKIIDCLQSGTQVLGIGPQGVSSIDYLRRIEGAIIIDDLITCEGIIRDIIENREEILVRAEKTRSYAIDNHEISIVQSKLHTDFETLLND